MESTNGVLGASFLAPDESNFARILELMSLFHGDADNHREFGARRPGAERIVYAATACWTIPARASRESDVSRALRQAFAGGIRWHNPLATFNVTPPPLLHAMAASALASLYNQNGLWDFTSGAFLQTEQKIVQALWNLMVQGGAGNGGIAVDGGKAALTCAIKMGMNRSEPNSITEGVRKRHLVFASELAHYSIEWSANQLGLGTGACVRIACDDAGRIDLVILRQQLDAALAQGACVSAIVLSGGDTIDHIIDPIDEVLAIVDDLARSRRLPARPFVYADTVNGWIWKSFEHYDFPKNPLNIDQGNLAFIRRKLAELGALSKVDGMVVDLHKTGLCPDGTSFFLCADASELHALHGGDPLNLHSAKFDDLHTHHFQLENLMGTARLAAAWAGLNALGVAGLQAYAAALMSSYQSVTTELMAASADFLVVARPDSWRVPLFSPRFGEADGLASCDRIREYFRHVNRHALRGMRGVPPIGIVPKYRWAGGPPKTVLMACPMSVHMTRESARFAVERLTTLKRQLEKSSRRRTAPESRGSKTDRPTR